MSQSTYYTCNGCDHATFRLSEAIAHMAFFGEHHSWESNNPAVVIPWEWKELFAKVERFDDEMRWCDLCEADY